MKVLQRFFTRGKGWLLFAVLIGAGLLALTPASVSASAAPMNLRKVQELSVQQQIAAQLKQAPDGIQTAWNELAYDHGKVLITYAPSTSTTHQSAANYGGCPTGDVCMWHGINYTGTMAQINASGTCSGSWYTLGFIGIGSYTSTDGFLMSTVNVYDLQEHFDFNILPGSIHHSPNTSANPDAVNATYFSVC